MTYTEKLVLFVKLWEGLKLKPSGDPLVPSVVDVGYGHVLPRAALQGPITEATAEEWLRQDLDARAIELRYELRTLYTAMRPYEFDAILSLLYNVGSHALSTSTMFGFLKAGRVFMAGSEFPRWDVASSKHIPGLLKRRFAEQSIFLCGDYTGKP